MRKISEKEENEMYQIINEALLNLCKDKPNNPVEYLSKNMLTLIGCQDEDLKLSKKKLSKNEMDTMNMTREKFNFRSTFKRFSEFYSVIRRLGVGENGESYLVESIQYGVKRVAKIINKSDDETHNLTENSIELLMSLDHPNIVKIDEIFEDERHVYIIEDYCEGGDIFSFLLENKVLNEELLKIVIKQILDALNYLHLKNIFHRNIKPENILIVSKTFSSAEEISIKLCDFGLTEFFGKKKNKAGKPAGIPFYLSPEVIEGKYDYKCDIWSVGAITYTLLCGSPPYTGNSYEIFYKILHTDFEYTEFHGEHARDFITGLMIRDPTKRPEIKDAMEHVFLSNEEDEDAKSETKEGKGIEILSQMSKFVVGKNLKRSVLSYILSRKLYNESNNSLLKLFKEIDKDGNGNIDVKELYESYGKFFPGTPEESWEKVKMFVERVDINGNGVLEYSEFLAVTSLLNKEINQKSLREVFKQYDKDGSGYIQAHDLRIMFSDMEIDDENLENMIADYDQDGDKQISFDEFYDMITKSI